MDGLRCTRPGQGETTRSNREPIASRSRSTAEYGIGYGMKRSGTQHARFLFEYRKLVRFRGKGARFLKVCDTLKGCTSTRSASHTSPWVLLHKLHTRQIQTDENSCLPQSFVQSLALENSRLFPPNKRISPKCCRHRRCCSLPLLQFLLAPR